LEFKSTKSQQSTNKSHEVASEESSMQYLDNFAIYDCVQWIDTFYVNAFIQIRIRQKCS